MMIPTLAAVTLAVSPQLPAVSFTTPNQMARMDSADNTGAWIGLARQIENTSQSVIVLNVMGIGGKTKILYDFTYRLDQIKKTGKYIIMNIIGNSYSAHASLVCAGDRVIFTNGSLFFHRAFITPKNYKEKKQYAPPNKRIYSINSSESSEELNLYHQCVKLHLLNQNAINQLWNNKKGVKVNRNSIKIINNF